MYGQRMGAMICVTPNKDIADEFVAINQYTSRATWSNSNSAAMKVMANICKDRPKWLNSMPNGLNISTSSRNGLICS